MMTTMEATTELSLAKMLQSTPKTLEEEEQQQQQQGIERETIARSVSLNYRINKSFIETNSTKCAHYRRKITDIIPNANSPMRIINQAQISDHETRNNYAHHHHHYHRNNHHHNSTDNNDQHNDEQHQHRPQLRNISCKTTRRRHSDSSSIISSCIRESGIHYDGPPTTAEVACSRGRQPCYPFTMAHIWITFIFILSVLKNQLVLVDGQYLSKNIRNQMINVRSDTPTNEALRRPAVADAHGRAVASSLNNGFKYSTSSNNNRNANDAATAAATAAAATANNLSSWSTSLVHMNDAHQTNDNFEGNSGSSQHSLSKLCQQTSSLLASVLPAPFSGQKRSILCQFFDNLQSPAAGVANSNGGGGNNNNNNNKSHNRLPHQQQQQQQQEPSHSILPIIGPLKAMGINIDPSETGGLYTSKNQNELASLLSNKIRNGDSSLSSSSVVVAAPQTIVNRPFQPALGQPQPNGGRQLGLTNNNNKQYDAAQVQQVDDLKVASSIIERSYQVIDQSSGIISNNNNNNNIINNKWSDKQTTDNKSHHSPSATAGKPAVAKLATLQQTKWEVNSHPNQAKAAIISSASSNNAKRMDNNNNPDSFAVSSKPRQHHHRDFPSTLANGDLSSSLPSLASSLTNHRFSVTPSDIQTSGWRIMNIDNHHDDYLHKSSTKAATSLTPLKAATISSTTARPGAPEASLPIDGAGQMPQKRDNSKLLGNKQRLAIVMVASDNTAATALSLANTTSKPNKTMTHKLLATTIRPISSKQQPFQLELHQTDTNSSASRTIATPVEEQLGAGERQVAVASTDKNSNSNNNNNNSSSNNNNNNNIMSSGNSSGSVGSGGGGGSPTKLDPSNVFEQRHEEIVIGSINNLTRLAFGNQIRDTVKAISKLIDQQQQQLQVVNRGGHSAPQHTTTLASSGSAPAPVVVANDMRREREEKFKTESNVKSWVDDKTSAKLRSASSEHNDSIVMRKNINSKNNELLSKSLSKSSFKTHDDQDLLKRNKSTSKSTNLMKHDTQADKQESSRSVSQSSHHQSIGGHLGHRKSSDVSSTTLAKVATKQLTPTAAPGASLTATTSSKRFIATKLTTPSPSPSRAASSRSGHRTAATDVDQVNQQQQSRLAKVHRVSGDGQVLPLNDRRPATTFLPMQSTWPSTVRWPLPEPTVASFSPRKLSSLSSSSSSSSPTRDIKRNSKSLTKAQSNSGALSTHESIANWFNAGSAATAKDKRRQQQAPFTRLTRISSSGGNSVMPINNNNSNNNNNNNNKFVSSEQTNSGAKGDKTASTHIVTRFDQAIGHNDTNKLDAQKVSNDSYLFGDSNLQVVATKTNSKQVQETSSSQNKQDNTRTTGGSSTLYPWSLPDNSHLDNAHQEPTGLPIIIATATSDDTNNNYNNDAGNEWTTRKAMPATTRTSPHKIIKSMENFSPTMLPLTRAPAIPDNDIGDSDDNKRTSHSISTLLSSGHLIISDDDMPTVNTLPLGTNVDTNSSITSNTINNIGASLISSASTTAATTTVKVLPAVKMMADKCSEANNSSTHIGTTAEPATTMTHLSSLVRSHTTNNGAKMTTVEPKNSSSAAPIDGQSSSGLSGDTSGQQVAFADARRNTRYLGATSHAPPFAATVTAAEAAGPPLSSNDETIASDQLSSAGGRDGTRNNSRSDATSDTTLTTANASALAAPNTPTSDDRYRDFGGPTSLPLDLLNPLQTILSQTESALPGTQNKITQVVSRPTLAQATTLSSSTDNDNVVWSESGHVSATLPLRQFATLPQTAATGEFFNSETIAQWPERYQTMEAKFTESMMMDNDYKQQQLALGSTTSYSSPPSTPSVLSTTEILLSTPAPVVVAASRESSSEDSTIDLEGARDQSIDGNTMTTKRTGEQSAPRSARLIMATNHQELSSDLSPSSSNSTGVGSPDHQQLSPAMTSAKNLQLYHYDDDELPNNHKLNYNHNNNMMQYDLAEPFLMPYSSKHRPHYDNQLLARSRWSSTNSDNGGKRTQQQDSIEGPAQTGSDSKVFRRHQNSSGTTNVNGGGSAFATHGYTLVGEITRPESDQNNQDHHDDETFISGEHDSSDNETTSSLRHNQQHLASEGVVRKINSAKKMKPPYLHNDQLYIHTSSRGSPTISSAVGDAMLMSSGIVANSGNNNNNNTNNTDNVAGQPVPYVSIKLYEQLYSVKPPSSLNRKNFSYNVNGLQWTNNQNNNDSTVSGISANNKSQTASNEELTGSEYDDNNNNHSARKLSSKLMYTLEGDPSNVGSGQQTADKNTSIGSGINSMESEELTRPYKKQNQSLEDWFDWRERERNRAASLYRISSIRHQVPSPITMYPFNSNNSYGSDYVDHHAAESNIEPVDLQVQKQSIDNRNDSLENDDQSSPRSSLSSESLSFKLPYNNAYYNSHHTLYSSGAIGRNLFDHGSYASYNNISALLRAQRMVQKDELNARLSGDKSKATSNKRSLPEDLYQSSDNQQADRRSDDSQKQSGSREDFLSRLQRLKIIKLIDNNHPHHGNLHVANSRLKQATERRSDDENSDLSMGSSSSGHSLSASLNRSGGTAPQDSINASSHLLSGQDSYHEVTAIDSGPHAITSSDTDRQKPINPIPLSSSSQAVAIVNEQQQHAQIKGFDCVGKPTGFYPDLHTVCQKFFHCSTSGHLLSFDCPHQTRFDRLSMKCSPWYDVNCDLTSIKIQLDSLAGTKRVATQ